MPIILATQEAEVTRTTVSSQPQIGSLSDPILEKKLLERAGIVVQAVRVPA
jgi:hypothetical protein